MTGRAGTTGGVRRTFHLPDLGEGLVAGEIIAWRLAVGDRVDVDQAVVEVETEKTVVELPCPYRGVIVELHAAAGAVIPVGAPLVTVLVSEESDMDGPTEPDRPVPPPAAGQATTGGVLVGAGPDPHASMLTRRAAGRERETGAARPPVPPPTARAAAAPAVRRMARELGVELHRVAGTGPGGLVTRDDVLRAHAADGTAQLEPGDDDD
ncbi:biotin/lipoyl-containing protein [Micromonospora sp. NPDC049044]|uniref:biotin/lipoyl-containing protein n=1 Tax=Micromonospora sp. NPDC049044 TaxID=3154827 RepID=UPI0033D8FFD7